MKEGFGFTGDNGAGRFEFLFAFGELVGPDEVPSPASPIPFTVPDVLALNFPNTGFVLSASAGDTRTPNERTPIARATIILIRPIPNLSLRS